MSSRISGFSFLPIISPYFPAPGKKRDTASAARPNFVEKLLLMKTYSFNIDDERVARAALAVAPGLRGLGEVYKERVMACTEAARRHVTGLLGSLVADADAGSGSMELLLPVASTHWFWLRQDMECAMAAQALALAAPHSPAAAGLAAAASEICAMIAKAVAHPLMNEPEEELQ